MPKVGGRRKKTRTHKTYDDQDEALMGKTPKAFVIKRGKVSPLLKQLVDDYRDIMYPYTAMKLQDNERTKIKDYLRAAGYYQMSHTVIITSTKKNAYIRFLQNPRGPTFTFRIQSFSNHNEVINAQRKYKSFSRIFSPALLVMNGFQREYDGLNNTPNTQQIKLLGEMIQSMFPAINIKTTSPKTSRRVVLFSYQEDRLYIRHYHISFNPKGIDKKIKKIIKAQKLPNLAKYSSFQDFLQTGHTMFASDTEQSDLEEIEIENEKKGDEDKKQQMSIRLHEVGPRLTLKLYKIEEGFLNGTVVYNRIVQKTNKAAERLRKLKRKKLMLQRTRREQQEKNIEKKKEMKEQSRQPKGPQRQEIEQHERLVKKVKV